MTFQGHSVNVKSNNVVRRAILYDFIAAFNTDIHICTNSASTNNAFDIGKRLV